MTFKAAIIGCGMIAGRYEDFASAVTYSHGKAYYENPLFGELAFYDIDNNLAAHLAEKTGETAFQELGDIFSDFRPDVVSICVPDDLHYSLTSTVMSSPRAPKLVFAEKPVCKSQNEIDALKDMEKLGKTRIIVNHSRRFDPAHQNIGRLLQDKKLGSIVKIHVDYYGGWMHLGVHVVDILQYFFQTQMKIEKAAYCCKSRYPDDPTLNIEGHMGSAFVRLQGHREEYFQILDIVLFCEKGQIKLTDFGNQVDVYQKTVNDEGENVLVIDESLGSTGMQSPITGAVRIIGQYLKDGDKSLLAPYGLEPAEQTMVTLWKGREVYEHQSR